MSQAAYLSSPSTFPEKTPILAGHVGKNFAGKALDVSYSKWKLRVGMKVLVTGANGLLGANLIHQLVQSGVEVKAFVRPGANLKILEDVECEVHRGNMLSLEDIHDACGIVMQLFMPRPPPVFWPLEFEFYKR